MSSRPLPRVPYNIRFPGQYYQAETGLNQNWNRDYDPLTGRYVESDPIGLRGGFGTYTYVDASPLSDTDSNGLTGAAVLPLPPAISFPWLRPVPLPAWLGPAGAVAGAGIGGYLLGSAIYPYIASPLGDAIDRMCSASADDKLRARCQALKDSILKTCYGLPPRKRMKCYQAADTSFRQCMGWE